MKEKFYIFTMACYELLGLPLAVKLQREGYEVVVGLIRPEDEEDEWKKPTTEDEKKSYNKKIGFLQQTGKGLVNKEWASKLTERLIENHEDNAFIIFDLIYGYPLADKLRKVGYPVLNASKVGNKLEEDRDGTLKLLKGMGIDSPNKVKFGKGQADKAIEFLKDEEQLYVLKSDNLDVITMVAEFSNEELIAKLKSEKSDIDKDPFVLQERIDGIESCVETWYWNGKPIFSNIDFEVKDKYNAISPPQCGCSYDLVFPCALDCKIREETMKKMDAFASKYIKNGILDLAFIYDRKTKKYYALEVCGSRFGYNAFYTLLATLQTPVGKFLADYMSGRDVSRYLQGYGASLRIFNDGEKKDVLVSYPKEIEDNLWLWDVYKKGGKLYTTGNESVGMISASGENPESAFAKCEAIFNKFFMISKFVRDDFSNTQKSDLPITRFHLLDNIKMFDKYETK